MNCIVRNMRFVAACLFFLAVLSSWGFAQETPVAEQTAPESITASIYYTDVAPRQLFEMLSQTFRVQFEGVDAVSGPLTLISSEQEMVNVDGMLTLLDAVLSEQNRITIREGQIVRIIPLEDIERLWIDIRYADVDGVYQFLRDLYMDRPSEGGSGMRVIRKHPELPRIFLVGPRELLAEIEQLVHDELDVAPPAPPVPAAPVVREVAPPAAPVRVRRVDYVPLDYIDAEEFQTLLTNDEVLAGQFTSAIATSNTLVVSAYDESVFARVEEMQNTFDVDRMEIRYYPLSSAQAASVATLLSQVYPAETEALPDEIARARRAALARAGMTAVTTLDAETIDPRLAEELQLTRAGVVDPRVQELLSGSITIVSAGELTIVPDTERNGLLIRTFSRNFPKILELIQQLDRPRPQVMIDVFITEVRLDDNLELGVDFSYTGQMEENRRTYTLAQDLGTALSSAGLSYQLVSDNINGYIRALQETGNLDIITRPQIVTKDNVQAVISLGRKVPLVDKTTVSTEGAVNSQVSYQDVATRLQVTPQIHPDGYVSLTIHQNIDEVSTETFQISANFNPQVIIKREAITQVRVKDGQTICLGGFISDSIIDDASKIPILGDIPLLGLLFRYTERQHIQTEMIIFITPHILVTPTDMLRMTNSQRDMVDNDTTDGRGTDILTPQETLVYPRYRDPLAPVEGLEQPIPPMPGNLMPRTEQDQPQQAPPAEADQTPAVEP